MKILYINAVLALLLQGSMAAVATHLFRRDVFENHSWFDGIYFSTVQKWLVGDFNGDSKDDLVNIYKESDGKAAVWTHFSTGEEFEDQSSYDRMAGFWDKQKWLVGDFNGDGKDDLVNIYRKSDGKAAVWTHFSSGEGFEYQSSYDRMAGFWDEQEWLVGDFNGDGKDDLVNIYQAPDVDAAFWTHFSNGAGFDYQSTYNRVACMGWGAQKWLVGDFDGDGHDDISNLFGNVVLST